jgi:hypothetical protein|tara:strand:- start:134 stop:361 length:228 start_codon:yes stop_codon:yes gene_type:complete
MFKLVLGKLDVDVKVVKDRKKNQYSKSDISVKIKIKYDDGYVDVDVDKGKLWKKVSDVVNPTSLREVGDWVSDGL